MPAVQLHGRSAAQPRGLSRHRPGIERSDWRARDFFCEQAVSVAPQIAAGTIKAYGISSSQRLAALPDVPTAKEAGLDYQMSIWAGIFAPKGTPKAIIDKLAFTLDQALDDPGVQSRIADLGGSLPSKDERTPMKFSTFVKAEIARWSPILKAANSEGK